MLVFSLSASSTFSPESGASVLIPKASVAKSLVCNRRVNSRRKAWACSRREFEELNSNTNKVNDVLTRLTVTSIPHANGTGTREGCNASSTIDTGWRAYRCQWKQTCCSLRTSAEWRTTYVFHNIDRCRAEDKCSSEEQYRFLHSGRRWYTRLRISTTFFASLSLYESSSSRIWQ